MTNRLTAARVAGGLALGLVLLAGCSSEGASTDCGLDQCTITFDRSVDGQASVLGVDAKLVSAEDDKVTLEIAGEQVSLTTGQQGTEVGGLKVTLESVTDSDVVVKVSR